MMHASSQKLVAACVEAAARLCPVFLPAVLFPILLGLEHAVIVSPAVASPAGDTCKKEICDSAVTACMRADLTLNQFARTEAEKKAYCAQFFNGCMSRTVTPDLPWYSPETVARFLKCPS